MRSRDADTILRRLERQAVDLSAKGQGEGQFDQEGSLVNPATGERKKLPRWHLGDKWLTFECGCRAEFVDRLNAAEPWDPVVRGFPRLALYDFVCHAHNASMNARLMGHYVDFAQWRRYRRGLLIGR